MPLAITPDHADMAAAATAWTEKNQALSLTRRLFNEEEASDEVDALWRDAVKMGWPGLLVPEQLGGSGQSLAEAAILLEALGSSCAPLPVLGTLATSAVLAGGDPDGEKFLRGIAAGDVRVGVSPRVFSGVTGVLNGDLGPIAGGERMTHLAIRVDSDIVIVDRTTSGLRQRRRKALDASQYPSHFEAHDVEVASATRLVGSAGMLRSTVQALVAADAVGAAQACLKMAVDYAQTREAFGRIIGSFQAVKHHCADMLLDVELATAATWRAVAISDEASFAAFAATAYRLATRAGLRCAKTALQVHGGIGFTWEHSIHLYLRRAALDAVFLGSSDEIVLTLGQAEIDRCQAGTALPLPPEAEEARAEVLAFKERIFAAPEAQRHEMIVDAGYLHPHWPAPWGLGADPTLQIVIDEETRDFDRTSALGPTSWTLPIILPTILTHGTSEQHKRWMRPTMMGNTRWCQLFSEPGAGSDLAALRTRAVRTDGGWLVTGQKVWTSHAQYADLAMALVRTDPDRPKHKGITCMVVDVKSPGVSIRPLRQLTGEAEFNEVFLDEVFVPDANVIGEVHNGWSVARATLGFERVSLGVVTWNSGAGWDSLMQATKEKALARPELLRQVGELALVAEAVKALAQRSAFKAVVGQLAGVEGSIAKLVVAEHAHQVGDYALELLAEDAAFADEQSLEGTAFFLQCRMATIAGGTSEVLRNLLAERALGLPREPEPARPSGD
jgi:alkylation response protein AidB-like acyl-CoA dehydrogenase